MILRTKYELVHQSVTRGLFHVRFESFQFSFASAELWLARVFESGDIPLSRALFIYKY